MSGDTVGNYRLLGKLGEGGMGAVFKGVDLMVEREVAIKMLRPEIARQPDIVERFRAEAVALAKLNHPNIATLYSFFREGTEYYMVMEFVVGQTLDDIIRGSPPMPIDRAITICSQVLDAIEHAHTFGILHRDIKPANIMVTSADQVKVTDFGIARVLGTARMTQEGCVCGTLEYLAPERIRGQEADIRSDLYSMGIVLYEMLTRHLPFEGKNTYELMRAHLEEAPPAFSTLGFSSVPPQLEAAVRKALAKVPEERYATAREFRATITSLDWRPGITPLPLDIAPAKLTLTSPLDEIEGAATYTSSVSAPPATTRPWKFYGAAAAILIAIGLVLAFMLSRNAPVVDAEKPAPAPVAAQPTAAEPQPQPSADSGTAPANESAPPSAGAVEKKRKTSRAVNKTTPAETNAADLERRKAALKALEAGDTTKPGAAKKDDRKSSALKALND